MLYSYLYKMKTSKNRFQTWSSPQFSMCWAVVSFGPRYKKVDQHPQRTAATHCHAPTLRTCSTTVLRDSGRTRMLHIVSCSLQNSFNDVFWARLCLSLETTHGLLRRDIYKRARAPTTSVPRYFFSTSSSPSTWPTHSAKKGDFSPIPLPGR